jgi:hypothetical protein
VCCKAAGMRVLIVIAPAPKRYKAKFMKVLADIAVNEVVSGKKGEQACHHNFALYK